MKHAGKKPNIIYILADDLGYGDVSCLNEQAAFQTRHLDSLAANGLSFTDAHATSAVCTPSRYAILTGRYNWRSRLKKSVLGGFSPSLIEPGRVTVAHFLQSQGYRTAAIGKWHLGIDFCTVDDFTELPDFADSPGIHYDRPLRRSPIQDGFDYFYGVSGSLDMPPYAYIENDRFTAVPVRPTQGQGKQFFRQGLTAEDFSHERVLPELTERVLTKISEWKDEPFFLYFPLTAPHTPILPPAEYRGCSGTNAYGDFVIYIDDIVGRIIQKLKDEDLFDQTIIIFTSDNGCSPMADFEELKQYGHHPSYVFRGHKADIYEGGHRIPLLVQWPAAIKGGRRCPELVSLVDFFATVADLIGSPLPAGFAEDSVSQLPLWRGEPQPGTGRSIVQQSIDGSLALRKGPYKLAMCPGSGGWSWPESGVLLPGEPDRQFFDLSQDIAEQHNRINLFLPLARQMQRELAAIIRHGRSIPGPSAHNDGEAVWDTITWLNDT